MRLIHCKKAFLSLACALALGAHALPSSAATKLDARYSGEWFNPDRNGEGVFLQMLDGDIAVLYFLTFPTASVVLAEPKAGETRPAQVWMYSVGTVSGNSIVFDDVREPYMDKTAKPWTLETRHWGKVSVRFDDCRNSRLHWEAAGEWGNGDVALQRLNALHGLGCADTDAAPPQVSGIWLDSHRASSHYLVQQLKADEVQLVYMGFDEGSGNPEWSVGVDHAFAAGKIPTPTLMPRETGPYFNMPFDPTLITDDGDTDEPKAVATGIVRPVPFRKPVPPPDYSGSRALREVIDGTGMLAMTLGCGGKGAGTQATIRATSNPRHPQYVLRQLDLVQLTVPRGVTAPAACAKP